MTWNPAGWLLRYLYWSVYSFPNSRPSGVDESVWFVLRRQIDLLYLPRGGFWYSLHCFDTWIPPFACSLQFSRSFWRFSEVEALMSLDATEDQTTGCRDLGTNCRRLRKRSRYLGQVRIHRDGLPHLMLNLDPGYQHILTSATWVKECSAQYVWASRWDGRKHSRQAYKIIDSTIDKKSRYSKSSAESMAFNHLIQSL